MRGRRVGWVGERERERGDEREEESSKEEERK